MNRDWVNEREITRDRWRETVREGEIGRGRERGEEERDRERDGEEERDRERDGEEERDRLREPMREGQGQEY